MKLNKILVPFVFIIVTLMSISCSKPTLPDLRSTETRAREVELGTIGLDLKEFPILSDETRKDIFTAIDNVSAEYQQPPMLLHIVFRIESGYQFWVEHPQVVVTIKGKKVPIRATGLGGIVWEFWADTLQKAGIAQTRSDLFKPAVNVRATGLILSILAEQAVKTSSEGNILPVLISKYYGQFDKDYESKMMRYSSDLFWKRISRDLMNLKTHSKQSQ